MRQHEADLLITDLRMPGLDGFQLLELIRARYPLIPVILITAYDSPETAEEALRKGAFDYIPKPFRRERIIQAIETGSGPGEVQTEGVRAPDPNSDLAGLFLRREILTGKPLF